MLDSDLPLSTPIVDQNILDETPVITYTNMLPIDSLIYDDTIDTSTIQNVILIDSTVIDFQLYNNVNTFPIVYSRMSTREQLLEILTSKFQNISRIAIIGHFTETPYFLNNEMLFSEDPVNTNTQFIIDLIKQFNVSHLDFLACGTLLSQKWTNYYTQLHNATGIPTPSANASGVQSLAGADGFGSLQIGASSDNTGNLKYGGDWILESTQEDIHLIYFNEQIQNYSLLLTSITYDNLSYTIDIDNTASVAANQLATISGVITIPNTFDLSGTTYIVTSITSDAFKNCNLITNIYIPSSVTTIGNNVFDGCTLLENITIDSARPNSPPVLDHINTIGLLDASYNDDNVGLDISVFEDDKNVEISYLQLYLDASDNDDDDFVTAFIVTDPGSNGILKIGSTVYDPIDNKTINSLTSAYWTPTANANGILTAFRVAARNHLMQQSIASVNVYVNVKPVNDSPTILNQISSQLAIQDTYFSYTFPLNTFNDIDYGDSLKYSAFKVDGTKLPSWLHIDILSGILSGTPQISDIGTLLIKIRATDLGGLYIETQPFNIIILKSGATLLSIDEKTTNPPGNTIFNLFNDIFNGFIDINSSLPTKTMSGIAINSYIVDTNKGVWEYSHNNGLIWIALPNDINVTKAFVLINTDYIRFVPFSNWNGTAQPLMVTLINSIISINTEDILDVSTVGGETGFGNTSVGLNQFVNSINDLPKIIDVSSDLSGVVSDSSSHITGTIVAVDVDLSTNLLMWDLSGSLTKIGTYGTMSINANTGVWTYDLSTNSNVYKALKKDVSDNDIFTVRVYDDLSASDSKTITITVTGINDPPKIDLSSVITGSVSNNTPITGQMTATDVDLSGVFAWDISGETTSSYGTISMIPTSGLWTYTLNTTGAAYKALKQGDTHPDTFTVRVYDDLFASDSKTITITVTGINDPPTLSGTNSGNVWEDGSLNATGILTAVDVDLSGNFRWDISGNNVSNYGKMSISSSVTNTCTWSYDLSNNSSFVQTLSQGQQITDEFYIRVRDDLNANATQLITITINGKNDPVRLLNKIPNQSIDMSSNFSYVIPSTTFLDIDVSDNLTYSVVLSSNTPIPSWLQFESSTRTFTSVSNRTTVGPLTIKVTATDGFTSSSAYFILNVISQQAISGSVLDGYIQGGTITVRDLSYNIVGGPVQSDQSGKFSIPLILLPSTSYIIDCSGGTDMATGAPILYPLSSIYTSGSSSNVMLNSSNVVINPLTTIVSDIVQNNISIYRNNISDVYTHVANAFGLQPSDIGSDYIYSHNIAAGIAAIKIATITKILSVSTGTDINTIKLSIATNIADQPPGKLLFDASFISDTGFGGSPSSTLNTNLTGIVAAISTLMDTVLNFGSSVDINQITNQYKELYKLSKGALSISFSNITTIIMSNISTTISNAAITQSVGQIMQDNLLVANICFIKGTNVVTDQGIIEIQNISLANTINGKKILMTTKTKNVDDYMVLIKRDALSKNVPNEDTWLTGEHCVLYNRKMVKSKNLVNGTSVQKIKMEQQEVYNLLLEGLNAGEMIANGMIAETLDPKSIFVKILTVVKSKNFSPEEEMACIRDLNIDLKKAHEKKMVQMGEQQRKMFL